MRLLVSKLKPNSKIGLDWSLGVITTSVDLGIRGDTNLNHPQTVSFWAVMGRVLVNLIPYKPSNFYEPYVRRVIGDAFWRLSITKIIIVNLNIRSSI